MKIITASIALYFLLALASMGVGRGTRHQTVSQLRLQVNAWWWIFPIVSAALAFYPVGPFLLCLLIGVLAARELSVFTVNPRRHLAWQLIVSGAAAMVAAIGFGGQGGMVGMIGAGLLLVLGIARNETRLVWLLLLLTATSAGVICGFARLPFDDEVKLSWLFYLFVLTALNDIGQYVAGKLFGRDRIAPAISPNKTWQGLFGGILTSIIVSLCLGTWLDLSGAAHLIMYACALSFSGFLGDLLFSAVKRSLGIKDFSALIPGHGGILDRVDSLVFTAPMLYFLLFCFE